MHTKDMLGDALLALGLMDMSLKARSGYYHDFLSPLDEPELQLCDDLNQAARKCEDRDKALAIMALRQRVINGDFDATIEESDAWATSPEGQAAFDRLKSEKQRLGDAPIEPQYHEKMNVLAGFLDEHFNGEAKGQDRKTGFVLMVFDFGDDPGRCNYISNGADRNDVVTLMKEMIARFEGQPAIRGTA